MTYRPIQWPPRPAPVHPKPVPPEPGTGPVPPTGTIPPEIVVQPPQPPAPPDETPQQYQPGWWSDDYVVVRQCAGWLYLDSRSSSKTFAVRRGGEIAPDVLNHILGILGAAARPTQVEPWPPAKPTQKSQKESILAQTDLTQDEKLEVIATSIERVAKDVADIRHVLVTYQEPAEPESDGDIWADAFALAEEPAGLDKPLESFDAPAFARYAVFARSPINGSVVYPSAARVALARALTHGTDLDAQGQRYVELVAKWGVDRDVAIAALLAGLADPYDVSFDARLERDVAMLAGTYKAETLSTGEVLNRWIPLTLEGVYHKLMPSGSGGTASGNEG